ncbi:hypothetical protein C8Q70DRAFT_5673 [Cubamyces menziesii]|nr:hypothetical protein C8Q70DRAFT_5673 [Cubamyces menziesii]
MWVLHGIKPYASPAHITTSCPASSSPRTDLYMSERRTRPIPIPPRQHSEWGGQYVSPGFEDDMFAMAMDRQHTPARTNISSRQGSSSSLIFPMDPEFTEHQRCSTVPPLYDLPPSTHPPNPSDSTRCLRCGRYFRTFRRHPTEAQSPLCHDCQSREPPHLPSRPHPGTPVATEFIPAWHRSSAAPADVPQPSPGGHSLCVVSIRTSYLCVVAL